MVGVRNYGWLGVDIFFVLSGFLIGTQLFKEMSRTGRLDFKSFYLRRAFRIFPAYFVVLGLYALFPLFRDAPSMQPIWRFATFTVNLGLDPRNGNAFTQAWTLSVEEQFYLVLPVMVLLLCRKISAMWALLLTVTLVALGVILRSSIWDGEVGELVGAGRAREAFAVYLRDIYYPTYTRFDGLLFGVLLAAARFFRSDLYRRVLPPAVAASVGAALVAGAIVLFSIRGPLAGTNLFLVFQAQPGAVAGFPLISLGVALLLGALLDLDEVLRRWPIAGAAVTATLSYSLYLTHKSVFNLDRVLLGSQNLQGMQGFFVYMMTSFIAAVLLWLLIERTFLRIRDKVLG
ncbi:acyltransferase [Rhizobium sp. R72]|nr:acyltransferase [Rhizobium sp. R72]OWV93053.1 acyltransferase [Rhizobium sp. R711]